EAGRGEAGKAGAVALAADLDRERGPRRAAPAHLTSVGDVERVRPARASEREVVDAGAGEVADEEKRLQVAVDGGVARPAGSAQDIFAPDVAARRERLLDPARVARGERRGGTGRSRRRRAVRAREQQRRSTQDEQAQRREATGEVA